MEFCSNQGLISDKILGYIDPAIYAVHDHLHALWDEHTSVSFRIENPKYDHKQNHKSCL